MSLLYYWRPDNYARDRVFGFGYHLNQNSAAMAAAAPGASIWAFTRLPRASLEPQGAQGAKNRAEVVGQEIRDRVGVRLLQVRVAEPVKRKLNQLEHPAERHPEQHRASGAELVRDLQAAQVSVAEQEQGCYDRGEQDLTCMG